MPYKFRRGACLTFLLAGLLNCTAAENSMQLSLEDCIGLALNHNLDLQIQRRGPMISNYNIDSARWGYYDPSFSFGGQRNFQRSGSGRLDEQNRPIPASESETDSIFAGLNGNLPYTGLNYGLDFSSSATEAFFPFFDTNNVLREANQDSSSGRAAIVLTQPLLRNMWIDSGRLNIRLSENDYQAAQLTLEQQIQRTITNVEIAYNNLIFAYESVKVQEMALELAERSLAENRKKVEVGALAPLEEKQTESQVAARKADLLSVRRQLAAQQNVLKRLISDDYASVHGIDLVPKETLEAPLELMNLQLSWDKGLTQRPDLRRAKLDIESQGIQLKYDRNQLLPQLDVFGTYGQGGSGMEFADSLQGIADNDEPFYRVGASITFPLSNKAARSRYRANELVMEQLVLSLKSLEQSIMVEIDDAVKLAETSYDRVEATRQAREYAELALEAEQKKLENGKSTSFIVLQLQNDLTAARSAEIRARADYNNSLAELSFSEGDTLDRHNIDLEVVE